MRSQPAATPLLIQVGATRGRSNSAYERYLLPHHPPTQALLATPKVKHQFRRVFLKPFSQFKTWKEAYETTEIVHSEVVELTPEEIASGVERGGRWIFYSVWEMDEPDGGWEEGGKGQGRDLVLIHGGRGCYPLTAGLSDYGLRYAPHILHFLKAGFRVIVPDLPSVSCQQCDPLTAVWSLDGVRPSHVRNCH